VGFDLYTRLLSDAVEEQRAVRDMREPVKARAQTVIDLPVDAYLPDDYVAEEPQKLELYRRLGRAATEGEVATIRAELIDRFGALPGPVERLLEVARLRITAEAAGIASLAREGQELIVRFQSDWSRSATMRAMAPDGPGDRIPGVPVGGISYGSNQLRVRLSREPAAAWATTRAIVERLAKRLESDAA
jgi:transcription-repair coupling factor (superfamily II helicase)